MDVTLGIFLSEWKTERTAVSYLHVPATLQLIKTRCLSYKLALLLLWLIHVFCTAVKHCNNFPLILSLSMQTALCPRERGGLFAW